MDVLVWVTKQTWNIVNETIKRVKHQWVTMSVMTRQVILLDLSSFSGSMKREVMVLVRLDLCQQTRVFTYMSQQHLVCCKFSYKQIEVFLKWRDERIDQKLRWLQEVKLRVLPLLQLPFIYIIEVILKLLSRFWNPKTTILGMMLSYIIMMNPSTTLLEFTHLQSLTNLHLQPSVSDES